MATKSKPSSVTAQADQIVAAVHLGVITEEEAIEFLVALKHGDTEAIERLWREHGCRNK